VQRPVTLDEVIGELEAHPYVALTHKTMANPIFPLGVIMAILGACSIRRWYRCRP
jgi:hypothetical protein